ncbi:MAG: glycosyltransferase [Chitinophagaceae bacterium]
MRVLWLSFTAAGAGKLLNSNVAGCGWISSLEDGIKEVPGITLAVGFFHDQAAPAFENLGVKYYPIQKKSTGFAGKLKQRLFNSLYDVNPAGIKAVIEDFAPDVIHIFGTESGMVDALKVTNIPIVIHLQGLVRPYLSVWFPKGMSQATIMRHSPFRSLLFRRGYYFEYGLFKKRAAREDAAIAAASHFFGRTHWDKNYVELINKNAAYIHCEEVLRAFFNDYEWKKPATNTLRLVTVINPQLYKGLEIILETSNILKRIGDIVFEWHVIGMNSALEIIPIIEKGMSLKFLNNNVLFKGTKVDAALIDELTSAHMFIHPSHIDNSPNSVCEAMLLGMPVIAGNAGGLSSLITHGEDGLLYNSYDAYELAALITKSYMQPVPLAALGVNARARAIKRHNIDNIISTVVDTYRQLINAPAAKTTQTQQAAVQEQLRGDAAL